MPRKDNMEKIERETIILFNEAEETAEVYTCTRKLKNRLKQLRSDNPTEVYKIYEDRYGFERYVIPKEIVSLRKPTSEKTRRILREKAQKRVYAKPSPFASRESISGKDTEVEADTRDGEE